MADGFHYLNGTFVEKDKCFLHVTDLSIQRSYAVFDYFIFVDYIPLYYEDNIVRFRNSIASMNMNLKMSDAELAKVIMELIKINKKKTGGIKLLFTGGYAANGYDSEEPNLIFMHLPYPQIAKEHYQNGIKLLLKDFQRSNPLAKTIDYFYVLSEKQNIKDANAFDILYHKDGLISESSRSNFFIVDQEDNIVTTETGILLGITRQKLIDAASGQFEVIQRPIFTSELMNAKEAFMTSSVKRVIPVTRIDDMDIGNGKPGNVTQMLMKLMKQKDQEYINNFRTP